MEMIKYYVKLEMIDELAKKLKKKIKTGGHVNCLTGSLGSPPPMFATYEITVYGEPLKQIAESVIGEQEWTVTE